MRRGGSIANSIAMIARSPIEADKERGRFSEAMLPGASLAGAPQAETFESRSGG
jgi:hypothetical protein